MSICELAYVKEGRQHFRLVFYAILWCSIGTRFSRCKWLENAHYLSYVCSCHLIRKSWLLGGMWKVTKMWRKNLMCFHLILSTMSFYNIGFESAVVNLFFFPPTDNTNKLEEIITVKKVMTPGEKYYLAEKHFWRYGPESMCLYGYPVSHFLCTPLKYFTATAFATIGLNHWDRFWVLIGLYNVLEFNGMTTQTVVEPPICVSRWGKRNLMDLILTNYKKSLHASLRH